MVKEGRELSLRFKPQSRAEVGAAHEVLVQTHEEFDLSVGWDCDWGDVEIRGLYLSWHHSDTIMSAIYVASPPSASKCLLAGLKAPRPCHLYISDAETERISRRSPTLVERPSGRG